MLFIDFHTHQVPERKDVVAVVDGRDTWGIHPWVADQEHCVPDLTAVLAIGECGLDALKGPSLQVQEAVFRQQIDLARRYEKPLVVHCVRAFDKLLKLQKSPISPLFFMFHGFRGKPRQLRSLVDAGFFVSFGWRLNEQSLLDCPLDRLMLETDTDTLHTIEELYNRVARMRGLEVEALTEIMAENYRIFFRNEPLQA